MPLCSKRLVAFVYSLSTIGVATETELLKEGTEDFLNIWIFPVSGQKSSNQYTHMFTFVRSTSGRMASEMCLLNTSHGHCLYRLNVIVHEYILLQISKLHDPHKQRQNENLSIQFFVEQECWTEDEKVEIKEINSKLENFYQFKPARNKIISHIDRSAFTTDEALGGFPKGDDEEYFGVLATLCCMIWRQFCDNSGPYPRVFDFKKSGLQGDSFCPSNEAREFCKLIMESICKHFDSVVG